MWLDYVTKNGKCDKNSRTYTVDVAVVILAPSNTTKKNDNVPSKIILEPNENVNEGITVSTTSNPKVVKLIKKI